MPVKSKRDEEKWQKAKDIAKDQGKPEDYAYIMGIYKKMKPDYFKEAALRIVARFQKTAGAQEFSVYIKGTDPKRAFREAVEDARHERGHGGYSGTIAEKSDFKILSREPMSLNVARSFVDKHMDDADKWGPALAVPIADAAPGKPLKRGLVIEARDEYEARRAAIQQAEALAQIQLRGAAVTVKILGAKQLQQPGSSRSTPQTVPKASKFFWDRDKRPPSGREYATKKDALDAYKALSPAQLPDGEIWTLMEKRPVMIFKVEGGLAQRWEVEVEITPEAAAGPIKGWLFFGLASS